MWIFFSIASVVFTGLHGYAAFSSKSMAKGMAFAAFAFTALTLLSEYAMVVSWVQAEGLVSPLGCGAFYVPHADCLHRDSGCGKRSAAFCGEKRPLTFRGSYFGGISYESTEILHDPSAFHQRHPCPAGHQTGAVSAAGICGTAGNHQRERISGRRREKIRHCVFECRHISVRIPDGHIIFLRYKKIPCQMTGYFLFLFLSSGGFFHQRDIQNHFPAAGAQIAFHFGIAHKAFCYQILVSFSAVLHFLELHIPSGFQIAFHHFQITKRTFHVASSPFRCSLFPVYHIPGFSTSQKGGSKPPFFNL